MSVLEELEKKAKFILHKYGIKNQLKKLNEESYELCDAILNINESTPQVHITEEIADVCVLLLQIKKYYNIPLIDIIKIMEYKINRQIDRIENETKTNDNSEQEKYKTLEKLITEFKQGGSNVN